MSETLAINGGKQVISDQMRDSIPTWPVVTEEFGERIKELYLSGQWSFNGTYEQEFCRRFSEYHNAEYGVLMVNGTVTLESALRALGVGPGDEVIIPALTWMATAMAVIYNGAKPVFVDIAPDTLCIDPEKCEQAITEKTKVIIPVHLYGSMADMEAIMDIAKRHGLQIVEDCAHAQGGFWNGQGVGTFGAVGSFSFQQSKNLTSGEGGICITSDSEIYDKLFRLKHIGYDDQSTQGGARTGPPPALICRNYRATEFQAAILLDGMERLEQQTRKRHENANYLRELTSDIPGVTIQAPGRLADPQTYYTLVFMFDLSKWNNVSLDTLRDTLRAEGLPLGPVYGPVYDHKLFNVPTDTYRKAHECSICDDVCYNSAAVLNQKWLLADKEVMEKVAEAIRKVASKQKALV